jgi:hypothetical protein
MVSTPVEGMFVKQNNCGYPRKAIMSVSMLAFLWGIKVHFKDD